MLAGIACESGDDTRDDRKHRDVWLQVALAEQQPSLPELGVSVTVRARGGKRLLFETQRGRHLYGSDSDGGRGAQSRSCVKLPAEDGVLAILVRPSDTAATFHVTLYDDDLCEGNVLDAKLLPVSTVRPDDAGDEDAGVADGEADAADGGSEAEAGDEDASTDAADAADGEAGQ